MAVTAQGSAAIWAADAVVGLEDADAALYRAKAAGRNRVMSDCVPRGNGLAPCDQPHRVDPGEETRPLSKLKRWKLVEVVERAPEETPVAA